MANIKNIAIIAHVDHGKTTLVDKIMYHCQLFRENQNTGDLILDNKDLERERGSTITSKNVSVIYKDTKINIVDNFNDWEQGRYEVVNKITNQIIWTANGVFFIDFSPNIQAFNIFEKMYLHRCIKKSTIKKITVPNKE